MQVARYLSKKFNTLYCPDAIKIHQKCTPLLGGMAIYTAFVSIIIINFHFSIQLKGVLIAGTLIFIMGLIDDIYGLSAKIRLLGQILAVIILYLHHVHLAFGPNTLWAYAIEGIFSLLWIIGITNAFNFFDGMDGLASGLAGICSLFIGIVAIQTNQPYLMYLALSVSGCCLGFLFFNFHPTKKASIFLGDSGSTFLGFMLATLSVMAAWAADNPIKAYSMPLLILGVLIFDMTYLTISRFATGKVKNFTEWIEYVGKDHFHHRLSARGLSNFHTVLFILFISTTLGLSALVIRNANTFECILLLIQALSLYIILTIIMISAKHETDSN